jgi:hypothetical protein
MFFGLGLTNNLRTIWDNGNQLHEDLGLIFDNKVLVSYKVVPELPHYTEEVVKSIVEELVQREMITFFEDIPQMKVNVPIWEIGVPSEEGNEMNPYYIETFHYDMNDEQLESYGKCCDVPRPLHHYLGFERELNHTDM